ncbi:endonuclease domain-containing protein [Herbaspirillum sp. GCM10030257]|uniref:endonuclease domain-containing protein n=1 Tax=Herbaspirillum sp. GCM10030257 TaxID=3273393 RepID=UPI00361D0827
MQGQTNEFSKPASRALRKSMTDAERHLWQRLRGKQLGVKFRRQHPFETYILDFVCPERMLIVEVDGSQHAKNQDYDDLRSRKLKLAGYTVLRFWNNEVLYRTDEVMQVIWNALNPSPP